MPQEIKTRSHSGTSSCYKLCIVKRQRTFKKSLCVYQCKPSVFIHVIHNVKPLINFIFQQLIICTFSKRLCHFQELYTRFIFFSAIVHCTFIIICHRKPPVITISLEKGYGRVNQRIGFRNIHQLTSCLSVKQGVDGTVLRRGDVIIFYSFQYCKCTVGRGFYTILCLQKYLTVAFGI